MVLLDGINRKKTLSSMSQISDGMEKEFDFIEELFKVARIAPESVEKQLDELYKMRILSAYENDRYEDYLTQQKLLFRVYRNSEGKHKVVKK